MSRKARHHHIHIAEEQAPEPSIVTNLEDLVRFIEEWLNSPSLPYATK
jgi:hypothetical protein